MSEGVAALPMYDWPEARDANDRLWAAVRDRLRARGVPAPEGLSRDLPLMAGWTHPRLVLGQTCGLPLVRELAGRVAVVGGEDRGLPGCPPGWYRSAVVVRADDPRGGLADFRGAALAVNGFDSQSGWGSILHHAAPLARGRALLRAGAGDRGARRDRSSGWRRGRPIWRRSTSSPGDIACATGRRPGGCGC